VLTTLPGVATSPAAAFAVLSVRIDRFPTAEPLYSATGLAPGSYQSSTINRHTPISRQGLPEDRDALMNLPGALPSTAGHSSTATPSCALWACGPFGRASRWPATPAYTLIKTQLPFDEQRYRRARHQSER
jgi:hypothetical protein